MMLKRLSFGLLLLVTLLLVLVMSVPVGAQDATATPIPTPTATLEPPPRCPSFEGEATDVRTSYYMGEGYGFFTSGLLSDSILSFTCVIRVVNPDYVPAYMIRGAAYVRRQEYDRAIQDYTRAIQLQPDLLGAYNNRGIVYAAILDYDRAERDFDQVLELDPQSILGLNNRAVLHAVRGDYDSAISLLQKAIDISGIENVYAQLTDPDRPADATPVPYDRLDARAYALLGVVYSARALNNYNKYLYLAGGSGDARIQNAAGALQSQFTFDLRLDDGTWLLVADFRLEG
ncbi:MAG: tetratricopeptide repeat protein [Anaerolineae bacterium]|nr:tetratricopeptide repeat protein [Anaerolineae bacterium]